MVFSAGLFACLLCQWVMFACIFYVDIILVKISALHPASHIVPIDIKGLCASPGSMYDFLASSSNLGSAHLHPLVEFRSQPAVRTTFILILLVVTFACGAVSFSSDPVALFPDMDVLSWFGGWYSKLYHWYNLSSLQNFNVFTPTHFYLVFQSLFPWFHSILFSLVTLSWRPECFLQKVSLGWPLCTLKPQFQQYISASRFFFPALATIVGSLDFPGDLGGMLYGAHVYPQLIYHSLDHFLQVGVICCQFCDNFLIRRGRHGQVVEWYGYIHCSMLNLEPWLACGYLAFLMITMVLPHEEYLEIDPCLCGRTLHLHSLQASMYFPDTILVWYPVCIVFLVVNGVFPYAENFTASSDWLK